MIRIFFLIFSLLFYTLFCEGIDYEKRTDCQNFAIKDYNDFNHSLISLSGNIENRKIIIISFFTVFCKPCVKELDILLSLKNKYKNENIEFCYSLVQSKSNIKKALANKDSAFSSIDIKKVIDNFHLFIDDKEELYELFFDKKTILVPAIVIIDKNRKIAFKKTGYNESENLHTTMNNVINKLLKEKTKNKKNKVNELTFVLSSNENGNRNILRQRINIYNDLEDIYGEVVFISLGDFNSLDKDDKKSDEIFLLQKKLDYNCTIPGDQEFINGIDFLKNKSLNFVSSNIKLDNNDNYGIEQSIIIDKNNIKVGIIGVNDPETFIFIDKIIKKHILVENNYLKNLEDGIRNLRNKGIMNIIIAAHGGVEFINKLKNNFKGVDIIYGGHTQEEYLDIEANPLLIENGPEGLKINLLKYDFNKKKAIENEFITVKDIY